MSAAVSLANDGTLVVHYAVGALQALEYGMRVCVDPAMRRHSRSLAMLCAQWRSSAANPVWVPAQEAALLEQFAVITTMRAIEANDQDSPAVLGGHLGFGDLRRRDVMTDMLYEPRADAGFPPGRVCAVSRTRRLVLDQTLPVSETGACQFNQRSLAREIRMNHRLPFLDELCDRPIISVLLRP